MSICSRHYYFYCRLLFFGGVLTEELKLILLTCAVTVSQVTQIKAKKLLKQSKYKVVRGKVCRDLVLSETYRFSNLQGKKKLPNRFSKKEILVILAQIQNISRLWRKSPPTCDIICMIPAQRLSPYLHQYVVFFRLVSQQCLFKLWIDLEELFLC